MQYINYKPPKRKLLDKAEIYCILFNIQIVILCFSILAGSSAGNYITNLVTAVVLALLGLLAYFIGKRINIMRIMNPVLNSIAIGISIGALYNYKEISLRFEDIITPMIIVLLLAAVNNIILKRSEHYGWQMLINFLIGTACIVVSIIYWNNNIILCGQGLFLSIFYMTGFFASTGVIKEKKNMWRAFSIMFFGVFVLVFAIVIAIICEAGDILDAIGDIFSFDFSRKKKNN